MALSITSVKFLVLQDPNEDLNMRETLILSPFSIAVRERERDGILEERVVSCVVL